MFNSSGLTETSPQPGPLPHSSSARSDFEAGLARLWAEILGLDQVGAEDNFFDIGGESISAMKISARSREAVGIAVSVRLLFRCQTVAGIAAALGY